jgi:hypothetical protein
MTVYTEGMSTEISYRPGDKVVITNHRYHQGRHGEITKVNGPKTVELRLDSGTLLWSVKVANLTREA